MCAKVRFVKLLSKITIRQPLKPKGIFALMAVRTDWKKSELWRQHIKICNINLMMVNEVFGTRKKKKLF